MIVILHTFKQLLEYNLYIAYNGYRCGKVLAYFRRVNINVYYRCALKSAYCGDRSVAYSRTEKYQQVAVVDSVVRTLYAVHTYHSVEQRIVRRNTAHTHHRIDNWYIRHLHELSQQIYRTCGKDTTARTDKRLFALFYGGNGTLYLKLVSLNTGLVRADIHRFRIFKIYYCLLNVKRHIYKHRSRSAGACDVKCVFEDDRHFRRVFDKIAVLYERLSRTCYICLLENVTSYLFTAYLSCDKHHRYAVHMGGCDCRDKICRTRSRCCYSNGRLSGHTGITACGVSAVYLMAYKHMAYIRAYKLVIKRTYSRTRITEYSSYTLRFESLYHSSCNRHSF